MARGDRGRSARGKLNPLAALIDPEFYRRDVPRAASNLPFFNSPLYNMTAPLRKENPQGPSALAQLLGQDPSQMTRDDQRNIQQGLFAMASTGTVGGSAFRPVRVTRELLDSDTVEMIPISRLEKFVVNNRLTHPKSSQAIGEPTESVIARLRDDLSRGRPIRSPLTLEVNPQTGIAHLADGNTRFAIIKEAGFTHVPVRISRTNTTFGQKTRVGPNANADRVVPSDFGL